jgi:prepilin-type processing-associated H-X9-DG protein
MEWAGWPYQILPFIEQENVAREVYASAETRPIKLFFCPSRRMSAFYSGNALMDYAAATPANSPGSWDQFWYGNIWTYPDNVPAYQNWAASAPYQGAIVRYKTAGGEPRLNTIYDGTSNTIVISEKQLNPRNYFNGDWHDDQGWIDGWDPDIIRYTGFPPSPDREYLTKWPDWEGHRFGSAHPNGINALMADGSVRLIPYSINANTFNCLGHRSDGQVLNDF